MPYRHSHPRSSAPLFRTWILLVIVAALPAAARAQIPGQSLEQGPGLKVEWARYARALADSLLRDVVTVAERREHETLARLFTDRALLLDSTGQGAEGREAIHDLLGRLPKRASFTMQVSDAKAGDRLLVASGRLRFEEDGTERTHTFVALMEPHHGRWQLRALAHAPSDGPLAQAPMPVQVLSAHGRRVRAPERRLVRAVLEPFAAREHRTEAAQQAPWSAVGAGLGLEIDRTLELRAFGWRQQNHETLEPISSYGGEARLFLLDRWRLRPFVALGAARFEGSAAPDTAWVPTAGGGLSARVFAHLELQVSVRDHLIASPDGVRESDWISEKRTHRPAISAGIGLAVGRRPAWRDSQPRPEFLVYAANESAEVLETMAAWEEALRAREVAEVDSLYARGALLYADGATFAGGREIVSVLRSHLGEPMTQVRDIHPSGDVAYVESQVFGAAGERQLLTVLERDGRRWRILSQVLP